MYKLLLSVLKDELRGTETRADNMTEETASELLELAARYDVAHLAADVLLRFYKGSFGKDFTDQCVELTGMAQYRYVHQKKVLSDIGTLFEKAGIAYIPLKGAVLGELYPYPWMRTCADIDILVAPDDRTRAEELILSLNRARHSFTGSHDVAFRLPNKVKLELHYTLMEKNRVNRASDVLDKVWEHSAGDSMCKRMDDAMLYCYHIAHMAKHFENGGCGIRPFIDLWLLNHSAKADIPGRERLLEEAELSLFAQKASSVAEKWFSDAPVTDVELIERYIFEGGMFGTLKKKTAVSRKKSGGRIKYIGSRMIVPYDYLKTLYPSLEKRRYLTPAYEVVRWFRFTDPKSRAHTVSELRSLREPGDEEAYAVLSDMGLL